MKKIFATFALCAALLASGLSSCNNADKAADKKGSAKTEKPKSNIDPDKLPNYRYVDSDSLLLNYNLAKDYSEEMLRLQNSYDNTARQRQSALENLAGQFQQKMQNNQYTSEQQYNADMATLQQRQNSAQNELGQLQVTMQNQMSEAQKIVQDSIMSYIEDYNATHHYDAIFMKAATLYIDPALDITDEIIKGLNERYNKVKK